MPKLELFNPCRSTVPTVTLLMLTMVALSNARMFISMADLLNEQQQQQLHLNPPLWRSATGLAPSFSPFRALTPSAVAAQRADDDEAKEEDGTMPAIPAASGDTKQKRRLVVRVPFAQNPDNLHLSRIYKSLFDASQQSRAKKYELEGYGLRNFVPFF
uniref:RRM_2 domain-containing protein n=1 Tax=Globodera pallida TaxID=36090 RepID=A0A183CMV9_GLOPA